MGKNLEIGLLTISWSFRNFASMPRLRKYKQFFSRLIIALCLFMVSIPRIKSTPKFSRMEKEQVMLTALIYMV